MKINYSLPILALLSAVSANFDIYASHETEYGGVDNDGFSIFQNDPSRDDVNNARFFYREDNVSGSRTGVRCVGACVVGADPSGVTEMEMNFGSNPTWHWTIYKNRNYDMIGLDGNTYGNCILFPGVSYNYIFGGSITVTGSRLFRCLTQYNVQDII